LTHSAIALLLQAANSTIKIILRIPFPFVRIGDLRYGKLYLIEVAGLR
jgi:hypothetical protein